MFNKPRSPRGGWGWGCAPVRRRIAEIAAWAAVPGSVTAVQPHRCVLAPRLRSTHSASALRAPVLFAFATLARQHTSSLPLPRRGSRVKHTAARSMPGSPSPGGVGFMGLRPHPLRQDRILNRVYPVAPTVYGISVSAFLCICGGIVYGFITWITFQTS